ncbi:MAG: transferase hexapeptide repeat family protein [Flavobacteriales bacterium]|nr:transferase hexapeptide repeat family protein [Flavobacteriales bacterium]
MANIFEFDGMKPVIHESSFIHPNATVVGNVVIGKNVYIGPGATLRGDWGKIEINDGCNVQENCTVHMFPGITVVLQENAHIGHGAIIHGAHIGRDCLVGMNAVIMDRVVVGEESIIGALTFVSADTIIEKRSVFAGNPGKWIKAVTEDMLNWKKQGTEIYQQLPQDCFRSLKPCEPLRVQTEEHRSKYTDYKTWKETRKM